MPINIQGELLVRVFSSLLYYWGEEEKTKEFKDSDGWAHTGCVKFWWKLYFVDCTCFNSLSLLMLKWSRKIPRLPRCIVKSWWLFTIHLGNQGISLTTLALTMIVVKEIPRLPRCIVKSWWLFRRWLFRFISFQIWILSDFRRFILTPYVPWK